MGGGSGRRGGFRGTFGEGISAFAREARWGRLLFGFDKYFVLLHVQLICVLISCFLSLFFLFSSVSVSVSFSVQFDGLRHDSVGYSLSALVGCAATDAAESARVDEGTSKTNSSETRSHLRTAPRETTQIRGILVSCVLSLVCCWLGELVGSPHLSFLVLAVTNSDDEDEETKESLQSDEDRNRVYPPDHMLCCGEVCRHCLFALVGSFLNCQCAATDAVIVVVSGRVCGQRKSDGIHL